MTATTRRSVLQALGVGGATALAGCAVSAPRNTAPEAASQPLNTNPARKLTVERIAANPTAIPGPISRSKPTTVRAELTTRELVAEIEPGVTYTYMTFDGRIPGPMIRARVGDRVEITIKSDPSNSMPHNIDLHAVRGPDGGAEASLVAPGETKTFVFEATFPGLFAYHCAIPNMDYHISSGMFGAILIEPEAGLPAVDHEFYLGQHELYTTKDAGEKGHHEFDLDACTREDPTYVLINGEKYAIGPDGYDEMRMKTGETARVFFVVGGPNKASSLHPIGSIFDEVWEQGAVLGDPTRYVQTTLIPPGSTTMATISAPVPGPIKLVDHSLSRVTRKGMLAAISVKGPANKQIFDAGETVAAKKPATRDGFDGWFDDVDNYDGVVDRTGKSKVRIQVGSQGNGGAFGFSPAAVKVSPGTEVVWEWVDGMHNVEADDGSFTSELVGETGHTFAHKFAAEGTTTYFCMTHKAMGMKGAVVVE